MCGIFSAISISERALPKARKALQALYHRGPDQWGEWHEDGVYIGHRRLSILDISENGKQPMIDSTGQVVLAVNGEIYNYLDLRRELEKSYSFKSGSDSEVILYAYLEWGIEKTIDKLDGMFAILLYDRSEKIVYAIRDRYGKKPLFYVQQNGTILLASEIKAFFEFDDNLKMFSFNGLKDWIYHRGNLIKETIYHNIFRLPPGRYLRIKDGNIQTVKYYDLLDRMVPGQQSEGGLERFSDLLSSAVKKRLLSDVPLGLQLSGGVDSSVIGYYLRKHSSSQIHSFSIGFVDENIVHYSEEKYARAAAEKVGLIHHQINVTQQDVISKFENTVHLFDGMLDIPNGIPIYLLSKYCKDYITVALTGEGADELYGGYTNLKNTLEYERNSSWATLLPSVFISQVISRLASRLVPSYGSAMSRRLYLKQKYSRNSRQILEDFNCYVSPETFSKIFGENHHSLFEEIDYHKLCHFPFYKQLLLVNHQTYLVFLLDRQDRASMGAAIESRLPFLDRELVEWSINLPQDQLFDQSENKKVLKSLCASLFGNEFAYRSKMGFALPLNSWLNDPDGFKKYVDKIFLTDFILSDVIDMKSVKRYLSSYAFDQKLLCYGDPERIWIKWFLMVIRVAQDLFNIRDIKE